MHTESLPETLRPKTVSASSLKTFLSAAIPPFVIEQITYRLRFVAWLMIIFQLFFLISFGFGTYKTSMSGQSALADFSAIISIIMTVLFSGLLIFLLKKQRPALQIILISVVYENLQTFVIALHDGFWAYPEVYHPEPKIFWSCLWILIYPVVVPYSPRISLLSSLGSICMVMLALLSPALIAPEALPPQVVFQMALEGHLVCAVAAYFISRMINHLNWQLAQEKKKGSYQLIRPLGEGSMGQVWLAKHRMLRRPAAMKIIHPDRLVAASIDIQAEVLARFEREAQATASLYNEHSISIYDYGTMEDNSFFYVMEALNGIDLQEFLRRHGAVPEERAVYLLHQITESLQEAHHIGLVHRDLKPANIFICRYGLKTDFIKVLDFGMVKFQNDLQETVARFSKQEVSQNIELTTEGQLAGTPAYMAPEMIEGKNIDHRYDIYAFGCLAYGLLTARKLFEHDHLEGQFYAHISETPTPPSQVLGKQIHPTLEALILKCVEKKPENRPQSIQEIRTVLLGLRYPDPWTAEKADEWWSKWMPTNGDATVGNLSSEGETSYFGFESHPDDLSTIDVTRAD